MSIKIAIFVSCVLGVAFAGSGHHKELADKCMKDQGLDEGKFCAEGLSEQKI